MSCAQHAICGAHAVQEAQAAEEAKGHMEAQLKSVISGGGLLSPSEVAVATGAEVAGRPSEAVQLQVVQLQEQLTRAAAEHTAELEQVSSDSKFCTPCEAVWHWLGCC